MNWMESLGLTLLHFMWQGLLIGLIAAIVNKALKRASANARYLAACSAMALMGIAAVGTFLWINQPAPALPESAPINPVIATFATFTAGAALTATPQSWTR